MNKYMIIEELFPHKVKALYEKFDREGRLLPDGVKYLDSWIDESVRTCYQLMESDSVEKILEWTEKWKDYAEFEIIPIIDSDEAKRRVLGMT